VIEQLLEGHELEPDLSLLARNEDDLSSAEYAKLQSWIARGKPIRAAAGARDALAGIMGTPALEVPVGDPVDVLVVGTPVCSALQASNPLQMQGELLGWLCADGAPLVKRGGTLIVTNPFTDAFDHRRHTAHHDFVHRLLSKTRDTFELQQRYEAQFIRDPALLSMHAQGSALHPAEAFRDWRSGEAARRHLGRMIAVGSDNEYIPRLLGFETAGSMAEALYRARGERSTLDIACIGLPQLVQPVVRAQAKAEVAA
jgi:hypothetical protein